MCHYVFTTDPDYPECEECGKPAAINRDGYCKACCDAGLADDDGYDRLPPLDTPSLDTSFHDIEMAVD